MRAILVKSPGGPEQLELGTYPTPSPGRDELLVRVAATALNRADILQRQGKYPPPDGASPLLGLELAGTIEAVGPGCEGWETGAPVCGLLPGGGYAEFAVLPVGMAMAMPPSLSFEEAAAVPEAFLTAFQALYWLGELEARQEVLIHAGGSGVGTAAIQLAVVGGAPTHVTASSGKHGVCRALGAATTIDYRTEEFVQRVGEATSGHGADLILDFIGAPYFEENLKALACDGRIILLATLGGARLGRLNLRLLFQKRARLIASQLRNRSIPYKIRLSQEFALRMLPFIETGRIRPVIDSVYSWTDVDEAHRRMEANENTGKIVLRIDEGV